ncbi:MAG: C-GCAxxG-C-C family protein [Candidatus Bathyarchaeia archaeon]
MDKTIEEKPLQLHKEGFNCAESVLKTVTGVWGYHNSLIPRIATPFGGGIGRRGLLCGALTGGLMAIGSRFGRDKGGEPRDKAYGPAAEFVKRFEEEFGSLNCYDLIECDLNTPEGRMRQRAIRQEKCAIVHCECREDDLGAVRVGALEIDV